MALTKIAFLASSSPAAQEALLGLTALHGQTDVTEAEVVVALGGDGFMLQTLHETEATGLPVYGMNCGTVGFLMNTFGLEDLPARLAAAEEAVINPLAMTAVSMDGTVTRALAINEVSLLRAGPQAAKLRIFVDGKERLA
ncbi:MAG: NAD(+) kinase, partial [uncultured bacterium]